MEQFRIQITQMSYVPIESQQSVCSHPHIVHFHPALRYLRGYRGRTAARGLPFLLLMLDSVSRFEFKSLEAEGDGQTPVGVLECRDEELGGVD